MKKATIALLLVCVAAFAQQKGTFTDPRDKKVYKTVKIGKQTWMAENLNYDQGAGNSACYDNKPENCAEYGRLYDWATAMNIDVKFNEEKWGGSDVKHNGVCPKGWHLPSSKEWKTLGDFAGGWWEHNDGELSGNKKLKAKSGWRDDLNDGTDNYGFSALPGGNGSSAGNFIDAGYYGYWWSSSEYSYSPEYIGIGADFRYMGHFDVDASRDNTYKNFLYSIRCVKD